MPGVDPRFAVVRPSAIGLRPRVSVIGLRPGAVVVRPSMPGLDSSAVPSAALRSVAVRPSKTGLRPRFTI